MSSTWPDGTPATYMTLLQKGPTGMEFQGEAADCAHPPASPGWSTRHPSVGKRAARRVEGSDSEGLVAHGGVVERYLAAHEEDGALWHVRYDDGDEEDLDEQELEAALRLQQELEAAAAKPCVPTSNEHPERDCLAHRAPRASFTCISTHSAPAVMPTLSVQPRAPQRLPP